MCIYTTNLFCPSYYKEIIIATKDYTQKLCGGSGGRVDGGAQSLGQGYRESNVWLGLDEKTSKVTKDRKSGHKNRSFSYENVSLNSVC